MDGDGCKQKRAVITTRNTCGVLFLPAVSCCLLVSLKQQGAEISLFEGGGGLDTGCIGFFLLDVGQCSPAQLFSAVYADLFLLVFTFKDR